MFTNAKISALRKEYARLGDMVVCDWKNEIQYPMVFVDNSYYLLLHKTEKYVPTPILMRKWPIPLVANFVAAVCKRAPDTVTAIAYRTPFDERAGNDISLWTDKSHIFLTLMFLVAAVTGFDDVVKHMVDNARGRRASHSFTVCMMSAGMALHLLGLYADQRILRLVRTRVHENEYGRLEAAITRVAEDFQGRPDTYKHLDVSHDEFVDIVHMVVGPDNPCCRAPTQRGLPKVLAALVLEFAFYREALCGCVAGRYFPNSCAI